MFKIIFKILGWILAGFIAFLHIARKPSTQSPQPLPSEKLRHARFGGPGYESSEVRARWFFAAALATFLGIIGMHLGLSALFFRLQKADEKKVFPQMDTALLTQPKQPPQPRLQSKPAADLRTYLEKENQILSSYDWIDPKQGLIRIPIERAMELWVEKHP